MTLTAIQGVQGAFSHAAAMRAMGSDVEVVECRTFEDLFAAVDAGDAQRGVVPVENTLAGSVQTSWKSISAVKSIICGSRRVRVSAIDSPDCAVNSVLGWLPAIGAVLIAPPRRGE